MVRILALLFGAWAAWYVVTDPHGAAAVALGILHGLHAIARSLSSFMAGVSHVRR